MTDNSEKNDKSSAEHVSQYLQTLDNNDGEREQLYYSQEQDFSAEELATIINEARLNELLAQSDKFLRGLNGKIKGFDEGDELK